MFRFTSFAVVLCGVALSASEAGNTPDVVMSGKFQSGGQVQLGCHDKTLPNGSTTVVGGGKVTTATGTQVPFHITAGSYSTTGATLFGIMDGIRPIRIVGTNGTKGAGTITLTVYPPISQTGTPTTSVAQGTVKTGSW